MYYATTFICRIKRSLELREVVFLNFAGVIRGAIAFGLVLRMDKDLQNRSVIVTTVLSLVIITTVIFGAIMTLLKSALLDVDEEEVPHDHYVSIGPFTDENTSSSTKAASETVIGQAAIESSSNNNLFPIIIGAYLISMASTLFSIFSNQRRLSLQCSICRSCCFCLLHCRTKLRQ